MYLHKESKFKPSLGHFMTNIDTNKSEALLKAANELALDIWWEKNATDYEGYPLSNCVAVFTTEQCDLTEFWTLYHKFLAE